MGAISKIYVGEQMVTRSKKRLFRRYKIKECFIAFSLSMPADCIAYLEKVKSKKITDRPANSAPKRRMSVACVPLFSINDQVIESSGDYFERIPRPSVSAINGPPIIEPTDSSSENAKCSTATIENDILPTETVTAESINGNKRMDLVDEPEIIGENSALPVEEAANSSTAAACASKNVADSGAVGRLSIVNNFDPFQRLPNIPFAMVGRKRRSSMFDMYRPNLDTIME